MEEQQEFKLGVIYAASAYIIWGVLPLYWKLIKEVPAGVILAHRIVWSFLFMLIVLFVMRKSKAFLLECKQILKDKRKLISLTFASVFISINWLTYIWAVNSSHVVDASLGYYINPLLSVILGVVFLKERLTIWQFISFILATIGVGYLTFHSGTFPWVAIILALSFGFYGLLKKKIQLGAMFGLTIETLIVSPIALIYLTTTSVQGVYHFDIASKAGLLLLGGGVMTAIPLLLFASGARRIPLATVGFLQYFAPTIMLFLGILLYDEPFTTVDMVSFAFIWVALVIYSLSRTKYFIALETRLLKQKKSY